MNARLQLRCWIMLFRVLRHVVLSFATLPADYDKLITDLENELATQQRQFDDGVRELEKKVGLEEPHLPLT